MRDLGMAVIVLLVAGMFWLPAAVSQPLGIHGDFTIDPGRRVGSVMLGTLRRDIENHLGPGGEWPNSWNWKIRGPVYYWPFHATMMAFCENRLFWASAVYVPEGSNNWEWLNTRTSRMRYPEGLGSHSLIAEFDRLYGQPVAILKDILARSTIRLYANGVAFLALPNAERPGGMGVFNLDICRTGKLDDRPYIPFVGSPETIRPLLGRKGDEAKGIVEDLVETTGEGLPVFKSNERVYFGLRIAGYRMLSQDQPVIFSYRYYWGKDQPNTLLVINTEEPERKVVFKAGEGSTQFVAYLGTRRPAGKYRLEIYVKTKTYRALLATIRFESAE